MRLCWPLRRSKRAAPRADARQTILPFDSREADLLARERAARGIRVARRGASEASD